MIFKYLASFIKKKKTIDKQMDHNHNVLCSEKEEKSQLTRKKNTCHRWFQLEKRLSTTFYMFANLFHLAESKVIRLISVGAVKRIRKLLHQSIM